MHYHQSTTDATEPWLSCEIGLNWDTLPVMNVPQLELCSQKKTEPMLPEGLKQHLLGIYTFVQNI